MSNSIRFYAGLTILLAGAFLLVALYAFSFATAHWIALGTAAVACAAGLVSFAMPRQGLFQRVADVMMCVLGAWAVAAALVMSDRSVWLLFGAGAGLAVLGVLSLIVRETELTRGVRVGDTHVGPDEFARMSSLQRAAGVAR